ncbi:hypothetical protein FK220_008680 [Flavobacteriaceae bacterium TP-CH-4]|uniref:Uncharacterized protein n=1 Tax=Pelagihabitans pacificus TaxID=2696054 RepID=A0A967AXH9_9FLAO|nr:hypothetical protein [Pelagihabitans pacificus]
MNNLKKKDGFKTPEGYFEGFHERLIAKMETEPANLPKDEGFKVPEAYFDGLNKNIQEKLKQEKPKVVKLQAYRKYYFAAASIAALLVVLIALNWKTEKSVTFQDIASSDIDTYFENHEIGLSPFEIAEVLPLENLEINDLLKNQIKEENIVDYLDENIDDFEELNLEDNEVY